MGFYDLMKNETNKRKTLTENGAVAYATSGKELLDFNFKLSGYRKADSQVIKNDFSHVFWEDPLTAIKYLFWTRDVRGGAGERKVFREALLWLAENKPEIVKAVIPLISEYGRYDDLLVLLDTPLREDVSSYYKSVLEDDRVNMNLGNPISLCAKWLPSIATSSAETRRRGEMLCQDFGWSPKHYRKTLSKLRDYLKVVETRMSSNNWAEIDYNQVPSKANLIYSGAFMKHDEERRRKYLEDLQNGKAKINAGVLQPHEIVSSYVDGLGWSRDFKPYDETLEQLWKNLPNETISNTLVVHDSSGSMGSLISGNTSCLDVASALAIYMAERNTGEWNGKYVTFSSRPEIVDISNCKTLRDKLVAVYSRSDYSNTDIYKTMKLILNTAVKNHVTYDQMPEMIVICSDMQFDGRMFHFNKTLFEDIIDEYEAAGYKMPRICFWNINDRGECSIPIQQNELGLILCSGFSTNIMKMFMSGELDPYKVLLETINSKRYDAVEKAVKNVI